MRVDRKGARWLEWRFVHSLPEMSFCQPVPGGMLSVINPSEHLSINSFSRVKPVCDMLHLTAMLWSCGPASLIFSASTGCICLRGENYKRNCRYPTHVTSESSSKKQIIIIIMSTLKMGTFFKNFVYV